MAQWNECAGIFGSLGQPKTSRNRHARNYFQVLVGLGIDLVHIRHLFKHSFDLPSLCRPLGIPVVLSFHDYYFVCPSIHLLDQNAHFCGVNVPRALNSAPFLRRC